MYADPWPRLCKDFFNITIVVCCDNETLHPSLVCITVLALVSASHSIAQTTDTVAFETAVIHPSHVEPGCARFPAPGSSHFDVACYSLRNLIETAFVDAPTTKLEGNQKALDSLYDVRAVTPGDTPWTNETLRPMMQHLLEERFHLKYHLGSRNVPGYELRIAKSGSKLTALTAAPVDAAARPAEPSIFFWPGRAQGRHISADAIAIMLTIASHKPTINRTALTGLYDVDLRFAPDDMTPSDLPSLPTAVKEQLGLELVLETVPVKTVVIDHVDDAPTEN